MSDPVRMVGVFASEEECVHAIESLRRAGFARPRVFFPIPSEKILEALELPKSPVRVWVLTGGITGALSGFALTIGTSLTWAHIAGGKPIISLPPYIIIAFELMILFGALSGVAAFLISGRLPQMESLTGYSPRFSDDRFGMLVTCAPEQSTRVELLLKDAGAEEVERETA
jgi:ActD protein